MNYEKITNLSLRALMALFPVTRLPPKMHDGKQKDSFRLIEIKDSKGKLGEQAAADW